MDYLIKVKDAVFQYPDKTDVSLHGEFNVAKGKRTVVLGSNGSGKTTLFKGIIGLMKLRDGSLDVLGMNPYKNFHLIREKIGVVLQNADEQIIAPTVYDDIALTLRNNRVSEQEIAERVSWIVKELGLEPLVKKIPHYLSGGEKKKVALAGALVTNPEILLLDEPFTGLDPKSKENIIELINHFNKQHGTTLLITTHEMELVSQLSDITYVFTKGKVSGCAAGSDIFHQGDLLKEANLIQPQLYEMFKYLIEKGYPVPYPKSPVDGADNIYKVYESLLKFKKVN